MIILLLGQLQYLAMRQKNPFNFQKEIEKLQSKILFEPERFDETSFRKEEIIKEVPVDKKTHLLTKEQEKNKVKKATNIATSIETDQLILYAISSANVIQSKISLILVKKKNQKQSCKELKKLDAEVSFMKFAIENNEDITLLVGTKCGNLLIYKNFETEYLTVSEARFTANEITFILLPSWNNFAFVLNKVGTIYLLNFFERKVYYEFKCILPLIEDPLPRLMLDCSESYLGHVFSYGRIIVWEITQEIKMNVLSQSVDEGEIVQDTNCSIVNIHFQKKLVLRPKMSITSSVVHGLTWADFLGTFIITINHSGELKVLAVNINQSNETQEFYSIISRYQICKDVFQGKHKIFKTVSDAVKLQDNTGIIVAKNKEFINYGKRYKSLCSIEKYTFDLNFKVCKIVSVSLSQMNLIDQLLFSSNLQYIFARNENEYQIIRSRLFQDNK